MAKILQVPIGKDAANKPIFRPYFEYKTTDGEIIYRLSNRDKVVLEPWPNEVGEYHFIDKGAASCIIYSNGAEWVQKDELADIIKEVVGAEIRE